MRTTLISLNRHMGDVINDRYGDLATLQEQLATGKRLLKPSDNPVDISNDLKLKSKSVQLTQFHKNMSDGQGFMSVTDTSLVSMNSLMQRTRELALQASNDTLSGTERAYIQREIDQLFRQVVSLANTNYKGDYIFAGTQTKIMPYPTEQSLASLPEDYTTLKMAYFDASVAPVGTPVQIRNSFDDTPITNLMPGSFKLSSFDPGIGARREWVNGRDYTLDYATGMITILPTGINPAALAVDVSDGHNFATGAGLNGYYDPANQNCFAITFDYIGQGKDVYGAIVSNRGDILREIENNIVMPINMSGDEVFTDSTTGVNLMETMITFQQNLLYNNSAGISASIDKLDIMLRSVLAAESKNGARMNRFDTTTDRNESQNTETDRLQAELEDAEFADTVSKYQQLQTVYEAALKSAAQIIQPSLAKFL